MTASGVPFHLLVLGPFARTAVHCTFGTETMRRNDETDALIAAAWDDRLARARAHGQSLFPGPMCGLRRWSVEEDGLHLGFGPTDYREFVGTNVAHPEIAETYGEEYLANGTGVCSVLISADDHLILQRRSMNVFEHPGMLHFCGGSLNPNDSNGITTADPFDVMSREFDEEMGIRAGDIVAMDCLGLARDSHTRKPDVMLRTRVSLTAEQLLAIQGDEHSALVSAPNDPASLQAWLQAHWHEIAPAGLACLVAYLACAYSSAFASTWMS